AAEAEPADPITLVLDVGHDRSTVCVVRGDRPLMARTIARGGKQVTEAVGAAFHLDETAAEKAKDEAAFVATRAMTRRVAAQARMDQAVRRALAPLVRELRQTVASFRAAYSDGPGVERLVLSGGGSRIEGLDVFLGDELGLPCGPLSWRHREGWATV